MPDRLIHKAASNGETLDSKTQYTNIHSENKIDPEIKRLKEENELLNSILKNFFLGENLTSKMPLSTLTPGFEKSPESKSPIVLELMNTNDTYNNKFIVPIFPSQGIKEMPSENYKSAGQDKSTNSNTFRPSTNKVPRYSKS